MLDRYVREYKEPSMKIPLVAFGLIAATLGFSDPQQYDVYDEDHIYCESDQECVCGCSHSPTPPKSVQGVGFTPQWFNMKCSCNLFATLEFLYWYGSETDLSYAIKGQTRDNGNLLSTTLQFSASELEYVDAKWKPGIRLGFGWNSELDGWDLDFYWTYYYNRSNQKTTVPLFAEGYPSLGGYGLVNPWVSRPIFVGILFDEVSAQWKFQLNTFDLELGRRYWVSERLTLRPFTGLRGAWTFAEFDVRGERTGFRGGYSSATTDTLTSKDQFRNTFWGIGISGGIQPTWFFSKCFSLYGSLGGALLWGEHQVKKTERYIDLQTVLTSGVVTQLANYRAKTSSESLYMEPMLDLAFGLRWENYYCCNQYRLAIDLGWENHILFHLNDRYLISGNVIEYALAPGVIGEGFDHYTETDHDVSFGGLVFRVRIDF